MPRAKKQHLKRRPDGRFACRYHEQWFYGYTEEEALQARDAYKRAESQAEIIRENPTVKEYADSWLPVAKAGISRKTYNENRTHLDHLTAVIGGLLMKDVRPTDIKRVYSLQYLTRSDSYIKHAHSLFCAMFAAALDDGITRTNPARQAAAKPHKGTTGSHRAITPKERKLIETVAVDHPMHTAAIVMLYAGLRPQEVKALRMEDIDTEAGVIHVRHFIHLDNPNHYTESKQGKTKRAARDVPLFPPVIEAVKGKKGLILGGKQIATVTAWRRAWESYRNQIERHLNGMQKRWYGHTREHKLLLQEGKSLPAWKSFSVTPYDLRHSFAAWCRDNGAELNTVVSWMGHADATMILHIYDEVSALRNKTEVEKLEKIAFGSQNGSQTETDTP